MVHHFAIRRLIYARNDHRLPAGKGGIVSIVPNEKTARWLLWELEQEAFRSANLGLLEVLSCWYSENFGLRFNLDAFCQQNFGRHFGKWVNYRRPYQNSRWCLQPGVYLPKEATDAQVWAIRRGSGIRFYELFEFKGSVRQWDALVNAMESLVPDAEQSSDIHSLPGQAESEPAESTERLYPQTPADTSLLYPGMPDLPAKAKLLYPGQDPQLKMNVLYPGLEEPEEEDETYEENYSLNEIYPKHRTTIFGDYLWGSPQGLSDHPENFLAFIQESEGIRYIAPANKLIKIEKLSENAAERLEELLRYPPVLLQVHEPFECDLPDPMNLY